MRKSHVGQESARSFRIVSIRVIGGDAERGGDRIADAGQAPEAFYQLSASVNVAPPDDGVSGVRLPAPGKFSHVTLPSVFLR